MNGDTTTTDPTAKPADAEVIFEAGSGPFNGLRLLGFAVWERRTVERNVTFPARTYSINGERRSFSLLRPANGDAGVQDAIQRASSTRTAASSRLAGLPDSGFRE